MAQESGNMMGRYSSSGTDVVAQNSDESKSCDNLACYAFWMCLYLSSFLALDQEGVAASDAARSIYSKSALASPGTYHARSTCSVVPLNGERAVTDEHSQAEVYANRHKKSKANPIRGSMVWSLVSSLTSTTGSTDKPRSPVSPVHRLDIFGSYKDDPRITGQPELAGRAQDVTHELPDTDFNGRRFELSTDPDRPLINSPKQGPNSPSRSEPTASNSSARDSLIMSSNNIALSQGQDPYRAGGSASHIMSFMSYDGDAGPQR